MSDAVRITEESRRAHAWTVTEGRQKYRGDKKVDGSLVAIEFPAATLEGTKSDIRGFLIDALTSVQATPD